MSVSLRPREPFLYNVMAGNNRVRSLVCLFLGLFFFLLASNFTFTFYNCIVPVGFLPRENLVAFPGKASCDRVALPNLLCMLGVLVFP